MQEWPRAGSLQDDVCRNPVTGNPEGPIPVPVEAVQLCITNAERLLEDAVDVSEPTAAALTELALEEALKGWILFFNLTDSDRWPSTLRARRKAISAGFSPVTSASGLAKELQEKFDRIPKGADVRGIFAGVAAHSAKLAALDFIIALVDSELKTPDLARRAAKVMARTVTGQAFNFDAVLEELNEEAFDDFRKAFTIIHGSQAHRLAKLKEVGLYVNLEGNVFSSPDTLNYPDFDAFGDYVQGIVNLLKGSISARTGIGMTGELEST